MKIQLQEIKQLNITAVFKEINRTLITAEKMRKAFKLSVEERKRSPFLELSPTIKILGIPSRQKDIIIEGIRLKVNDNSSKEPTKSELVKYFQTAFNNLVDKTELLAYGFNYDVLIQLEKKINFERLLGNNLLKSLTGSSILESGARVLFSKDNKHYDLQISPTKKPQRLLFHLNTHYASKKINFQQLPKQFNENYSELIKIIKKI